MAFNFVTKKTYKVLKKEQKQIDWLMLAAGIVGPLSALPQLVDIYRDKSAHDLSLISWSFFLVLCVIYFCYAIVHRIKPLIIAQFLWIAVYGLITLGIVIYGS